MSQQPDPPIVVSGGSVNIEYDEASFTKNGKDKHTNANKKIKRVEITINGNTQTFDVPNGKVIVAVHYGNP